LSKTCKAKAKDAHRRFTDMKKKYEKDANEQMLELFNEDFIDQKNQLEDTLDNLLAQQATINEVDPSVLDEYNNRLKEVDGRFN
jgi:retron-type reverse transcriptase